MNKVVLKKLTTIVIVIILSIFLSYFSNTQTVKAQQNQISLSITPPLLEIMIKPGQEYKHQFTIENKGIDSQLIPNLYFFVPADDFGNIEVTTQSGPDWIIYKKEPITLKSGQKIDFDLKVSPPSNLPETDYLLTLVFETENKSSDSFLTKIDNKISIAANILLTVSLDGKPKKSSQILEFSAPKIIDSFMPIEYKIKILNDGNSFWKPIGFISINEDKKLKLAPQNIVSGYSRQINCLDNEALVECLFDQDFLIGKYTSSIEYSIEGESTIYKQKIDTYAFPFSVTVFVLTVLTVIRFGSIVKLWLRQKRA